MSKQMEVEEEKMKETQGLTRRELLKSAAFVGGCSAFASVLGTSRALAERLLGAPEGVYELSLPENVIYTTCLQCHVDCPIKTKYWDGVLAKITGNPYSPQSMLPHIPYETSPKVSVLIDAKVCPKGQAGIQTYYDPYRIRKVLKRVGPRGSNRWKSIPFDQFIKEVVEGGKLFSEAGENRHVAGFKEVLAVRDEAKAKALKDDAKKFAKGEITLEQFRSRHGDLSKLLVDPQHPDLGPRNNGFTFLAGRIEHGRKEFGKWFTKACGSVNFYEHTTICEQSHHIAFSEMTHHKTHHLKPDLLNSEFVIFWGTGAFEANFGLTPMAEKVTSGLVERGLKMAVVDPRLSKTAAKAKWWLPVKPGKDVHLAMAMHRWILENGRYDARFLANANKAAAKEDGESCWSDATALVFIEDGRPARYVRGKDLGRGGEERVIVSGGRPVVVKEEGPAQEGELFAEVEIGGKKAKTVLSVWRDEAFKKTIEDWAKEAGVPVRKIVEVAREFTSHGKRSAIDLYRGPVQHANGLWAAQAIIALNVLIGNIDWKGGLSKGGGHWHEDGSKPAGVFKIKGRLKKLFPTWGPKMSREKARYEDYSLFREQGYKAPRLWYPFSGNIYQEVIPSAAARYPYGCEILLLHKGTPALSTPAGHRYIETLKDPKKIPLFIASDIVIGETSMYADYILPDLTYLERWGTPHVTPDVNSATSKVRQPAAKPLTEECTVAGEKMPISLEAFCIAVGKALKLPGFGKNAVGEGASLDRPEDFYLKAVANLAVGDKPGQDVPEADGEELAVFRAARRHLPPSVFDEAKWKRAIGNDESLWRKVVYVLNRGGRYAPFETAYDGKFMKKRLAHAFHLFYDDVARSRNAMTGAYFPGLPLVDSPVAMGVADAKGRAVRQSEKYPLALFTFKESFGGHSRTISNYWTNLGLYPENYVLLNVRDAARYGVRDGETVRLVSEANPEGVFSLGNGEKRAVEAKVKVLQGIRPGTVGVSWHFGHWAYGSRDVVVDGGTIRGDRRRAAGACPNPLMLVDPALGDMCLTDPIGASSSFYDTRVNIVKV
ncbi:MAG: molybdopterin oxidoreductase [Candidatus Hydrogenedentota bacterium]|nr:MAG: molybdopterin oxidoreductase [Candidatus Hydrogenedentota bacterium]